MYDFTRRRRFKRQDWLGVAMSDVVPQAVRPATSSDRKRPRHDLSDLEHRAPVAKKAKSGSFASKTLNYLPLPAVGEEALTVGPQSGASSALGGDPGLRSSNNAGEGRSSATAPRQVHLEPNKEILSSASMVAAQPIPPAVKARTEHSMHGGEHADSVASASDEDNWMVPRKRKIRGNEAQCTWYAHSGDSRITAPQRVNPRETVDIGTLYLYWIGTRTEQLDKRTIQIWMWDVSKDDSRAWRAISAYPNHPLYPGLTLSFTPAAEPAWIKPVTARRPRALPRILVN
ncbi:uncharacterized protein B0H18DRAFT_1120428 [Fomitopsis serialis]|uniref:uncharacterized protein n=1 Tax=Fomitopsis serialis TaxID=139415 RepID=UPI002007836B|nr:uncharacterized protein B0H18DRAFT_1120428 [Neoantrodia serialis]KAH9923323.1 hypothetical protein B0H18DRAFT_1120428 [Neoantrodia serialis]